MNDLFEKKQSTSSQILVYASDLDEIVCVCTRFYPIKAENPN